jgi:Ca-activated chloride channel homolog
MSRWAYPRAAFLAVCAPSLCAGFVSAQERAQTQPNIRVTVDRVNVGVIVTDSRGAFVQGLQRNDFRLLDDGVEQPVTDFLSIDEPAQVLLLVEAGPAVYLLQGGHVLAVHTLLEGLAPADRVAIARYDERAEPLLNFIADKQIAASALDQLHFNLGFGQLNLASSLSTALDWLADVPGKKSLVLLTTGVDTSPSDAFQKVLERLKTTDVRVLAVSLVGDTSAPADKKSSKKNQPVDPKVQATDEGLAKAHLELTAIADANGSRAYFPKAAKDFTLVFGEISQLIRHEYNLGFVPPVRDGKTHMIEVIIGKQSDPASGTPANSEYRVSHRKAYLAPAPGHD